MAWIWKNFHAVLTLDFWKNFSV